MNETVLLQKKEKGKIVQVPCKADILTPEDEKETCSFYEMIADMVGNPEIFVPHNTLPTDLAGDGIVLGVKAESRLICVRVLTFNRNTISEYKDVLGDELLIENTACSDGCAVDSRYRGNNLQQLTWFRIEPLLYGKHDCVLSTVSPKNIVSLKNLLSCGFTIIARANMYGGYDRFVLKKKLSNIQCIKTEKHMEINVHDREKMVDMLSNGYVGYKMRHRSTGINILLGQEING